MKEMDGTRTEMGKEDEEEEEEVKEEVKDVEMPPPNVGPTKNEENDKDDLMEMIIMPKPASISMPKPASVRQQCMKVEEQEGQADQVVSHIVDTVIGRALQFRGNVHE